MAWCDSLGSIDCIRYPYKVRTANKKATSRWLNLLIPMVRPVGIEPTTPAFGGHKVRWTAYPLSRLSCSARHEITGAPPVLGTV